MTTTSPKPRHALPELEAWLRGHHAAPISELEPLEGGYWSAAYGYRAGGETLVLRLGESPDGFRIDEAAMAFASPDLPVPEVLGRGNALGCHYAISRRHFGRMIERAPASEAEAIGTAMGRLLQGLRAAPGAEDGEVEWYAPRGTGLPSWHAWLLRGLEDVPGAGTAGWRETLATRTELDAVFRACEARIRELLPACPERRDLVHGDLLHQNVLVAADDPSRVTAVFSWKCSTRGDFLYDVAWCTHWSPWHPAIAGADLWRRTFAAEDLSREDLRDAALRHHCYELQISASHFGWYVFTQDDENLGLVADLAAKALERGPLEI